MTAPIASLGMYDHPAQRAANDRLWTAMVQALGRHGVAAPPGLDRSRSVEAIWRDPNLLFAQTCGYPLISDRDLALKVVGIPVYDAPDCADGEHLSYLVTRTGDRETGLADYRGRRAAINARHSNTGHNLFRAAVAPLATDGRFFSTILETGSHRASIDALARAEADIAAIDAVTFAALRRFEPDVVAGLRILGVTAISAAPPFVTARSTSDETVAALRAALAAIVSDPTLTDVRETLFLGDVVPGRVDRFAPIRALEIAAIGAGYPTLQ